MVVLVAGHRVAGSGDPLGLHAERPDCSFGDKAAYCARLRCACYSAHRVAVSPRREDPRSLRNGATGFRQSAGGRFADPRELVVGAVSDG